MRISESCALRSLRIYQSRCFENPAWALNWVLEVMKNMKTGRPRLNGRHRDYIVFVSCAGTDMDMADTIVRLPLV